MQFIHRQRGQALAESIIGMSFVVIPLLLLLPFVSKITGVQHRANQAAQYAAWERTVWKEQAPSRMVTGKGIFLAKKTEQQLSAQLPWRFYQGKGQVIDSRPPKQWNWEQNVHPLLKHQTRHDGSLSGLIKDKGEGKNRLSFTEPSSKIPGTVNSLIGKALGVLAYTGFSLEQDQFYRTRVETDLVQMHLEPFDSMQLTYKGNSALLASGWNAAGPEHLRRRAERLVPTNYADVSWVRTAQKVASFIPFGKELHPNSLKLGHVEAEVLPANRLCNYGSKGCGG
ncbi:hypothetical protein [Shewanella algae]|uniref:hypothetical protein n=1 Tax=Shewanella algae TaxID=38313 RepID=UPI001AAF7037|nr:hypothetical protein [Shewanella algae]EKT4488762.1 hypothetical protein [Shewanella algae]MBO2546372.1 hypothetical protein [Shewanella algae]